MLGTIAMPLVRHLISGAAGYLVANGLVDAAMQDTAIGVGVGLVALVMSYFDKAKKKA